MPEYLAPGVYVEEVSFRAKSIEGVSTSVTGFIGPARYGPARGEPELLTSFADYSRIYGGLDLLEFEPPSGQTDLTEQQNYLAHAVRAFFDNGGSKLYVTRIYESTNPNDEDTGKAFLDIGVPATVTLRARFPGAAGNMRAIFALKAGPNILSIGNDGNVTLRGVKPTDVVYVQAGATGSPPAPLASPSLEGFYDVELQGDNLVLNNSAPGQVSLSALATPNAYRVHVITVIVSVQRPGLFELEETFGEFSPHPESRGSLTDYFTQTPSSRNWFLTVPFAIETAETSGSAIIQGLIGTGVLDVLDLSLRTDDELQALSPPQDRPRPAALRQLYTLAGGSDGRLPTANSYEGSDTGLEKTGLETFADLEEISIVAAPGFSANYNANPQRAVQIAQNLLTHVERMRYRVAVLDAPDNQLVSGVREFRGKFDSKYAALYYPWIRIIDPLDPDGRREILVPPSGYVAGIYARTDAEQGVFKAPANAVARGALGLEILPNKAQQDILNPEGVNCFRFFEGRGFRLWGARTISSDPEWKYISVRRYFAYLERSVDKGTQYVVFEINSEPLWANLTRTVEDFLFNEWKSGALLGSKPEEAFFVRCDRSTMTQNDLDNGRLICLIGVAVVKPAEFVIFRIGQWTADRKV
jgi:uncharacterized protein